MSASAARAGAEEARLGTMEELRDIKFRTRAIRLGQNTTFESQNVDLVTAAVRIEELSDQVVEVTEYFQMNKLKLEDVSRERDELLAFKENAAKRDAAKAVGTRCSRPKACSSAPGSRRWRTWWTCGRRRPRRRRRSPKRRS